MMEHSGTHMDALCHQAYDLNLAELAAAEREFCVIGVPLKFRGATGSPVRPLALVGQSDCQAAAYRLQHQGH